MWEPFRLSMEQWAPECRIVYDKFHIMQHANDAVDEVRRAEFFRKGGSDARAGQRKALAAAEPLDEPDGRQAAGAEPAVPAQPASVQGLHPQRESGPAVDLPLRRGDAQLPATWIDQLRWQRLEPFQKLAEMLLDHLDGILNYCRTKVRLGVVEAVNGNIKSLLRRGRGYKNLRYLLLKAQRMAATRTEYGHFKKAA